MGKSTETFSKKEREKKKLKKQQEKKEKAEDRKAAGGGKSFEDMMAYVDENGNITSTPPDPSRRRKIAAEDIQLGTPKREDMEVEIARTGIVSFFNDAKGFGFIRDLQTQESIFVHVNGTTEQIKEGDKVTFETEQGQKGLTAIKVAKASK
ncbi:cold-shock protein [Mucilaginibacter sp. L3T2-6]|uniref:cold-shock protein n=1 Tax=Mucilaginibacter sp. L3T2-6 TaxID=3062491 RepID=UPI002676020D|nr:cold shock domain-containing protein [Mucilaginibacter sp. L3T2-6]MDO3645014.1 cold shock domain-containing protein [Mucilaginibacter sp. L3T2-6]MDV6217465.1 cold shock domain-containing protein [Mucilaginibacter sp. L3T2-6]